MCVGCHGDNGISQTENIPSLAGQPDQFLQWQLVFFRGGSRKNEQMQPIAEAIGNEDVRALGAYFAALTPPKATTPDDNPDLSKKGAQAAVGRRCASCHTDSFAGTQGGGAARRPARGISGQGAARLQNGRADRRRRRRDDGCRLSPQRRGNPGAGALSRAFSISVVVPALSRDPYAVPSRFRAVRADNLRTNCGRWLWVPAFAGTTSGVQSLSPLASHTPSDACRRCAVSAPAPWRRRRAR